jgi:hypothetical protein
MKKNNNLDIKILRLLTESVNENETSAFYNDMKAFIKYLHLYESLHMDTDNLSYKKPLYKKFEQEVQNQIKQAAMDNPDKTYILTDDFKQEKMDILNSVKSKYIDQLNDPNYRENFATINGK